MTGNELKERRKRLGLTQAQLGEKLGTTGNTIARWEREATTCPYPEMLELALGALEASYEGRQQLEQLIEIGKRLQEVIRELKKGD